MSGATDPDLDRLIVAYLAGEADAAEVGELDRRLIADPVAAARLAWWGRQDVALRALGAPAVGAAPAAVPAKHRARQHRPPRPASSTVPWRFAVAAALILAITGGWWMTRERRADTPTVLAVVRTCAGDVSLSHRAGSTGGTVVPGTVLVDGDALSCGGAVIIDYPDGTAVAFGPGTSAALSIASMSSTQGGPVGDADTGAKRVRLERGTLRASVARQPAGLPMRIVTPLSETTVVGTRFSLTATPAVTRLEVDSGTVRFTRLPDGAAIDVGAGSAAVAGPAIELVARAILRDAVDMALKRPATASSSFVGKPGDPNLHTPAQANDGDPSTCWGTAVDRRGQPDPTCWWQVDLGEPCRVERIELMARQDEFDQRDTRATFEIRGGDRADGSDAVLLARHEGEPFAHRGTWTATVSVATPVRYVRVVQLVAGYMGMAEVRVIARPASALAIPPWPDRGPSP